MNNVTLSQFSAVPMAIAAHAGAPLAHIFDTTMHLCLNRPDQHNRLDPHDLAPLTALFKALTQDHESGAHAIRCLVITGAGEKTFSSGYTLDALASQLDFRFEAMLNALEDLPQYTIAALNGSVYGGATDLALACDARIGLTGTKMFMPAAKIGLHYYPSGLRRYVSKIGHTATSKLMLTALTIDCYEMLRIGYLTELCERDQQLALIQRYAHAIAANDPIVVAQMKLHIRQIAEGKPDYSALEAAHVRSLKSDSMRIRLAGVLKK